MPKIQKTIDRKENVRYSLTLPKAIVESKGWDKGTKLICHFNQDGNLVFQKLE